MVQRVRNLAVLYLALAHGTDQHLHLSERRTMAQKLRVWLPEMDPKLIEHVVREAAMDYEQGVSEEELHRVVRQITLDFDEELRMVVLEDLADIAEADRIVYPEEVDFVRRLAEHWNLDAAPFFK